MIELFFSFGSDYILIRIDGNNILFGNTAFGGKMASIDGLKLSLQGAIKEFPDLKGDSLWREKAIARFKLKTKSMETEEMKVDYIIDDLKMYGYVPLWKQKRGFRKERIGNIA